MSRPRMIAGARLVDQAIERTHREIADPWGTWGTNGMQMHDYKAGKPLPVSAASVAAEARERLEVLLAVQDFVAESRAA